MSMSAVAKPKTPRDRILTGELLRRLRQACDTKAASWLIVALILVSLAGACASLAPLALKQLVDFLDGHASAHSGYWKYVVAYVSTILLQRLFEQIQGFAYANGEQRLIRNFGRNAFSHILSLDLNYHLNNKSGQTSQTLANGVLGVRMVLTQLAMTIIPICVQIIVATAVLATELGGAMSFVLLVTLGAYALIFSWSIASASRSAKNLSSAQADLSAGVTEALLNIETIKCYLAEEKFTRTHEALQWAVGRNWIDLVARRVQGGIAVAIIFAALNLTVLGMASMQVAADVMSLGAFTLINVYLIQFIRPVELIGFALRDMSEGLAFADRLMQITARERETADDRRASSPVRRSPAELEFTDVSFSVGERAILKNVSFHAPPGSTVALVGPSGAGKSTLLRLALGLFKPHMGVIRLDGRDIRDLPLAEIRAQIAIVSQDTILFNDTIAANIAPAMETVEPDVVEAAIRQAQLSELVAKLPDGLGTIVGERGLRLSGGEKQRVAIARAAFKEARLVIFDEATAALDPKTEAAVWSAIRSLSRQVTAIVVTHRLSTISEADQIIVLDHGEVVERGRHDALLTQGGLYSRLWRSKDETLREARFGFEDAEP